MKNANIEFYNDNAETISELYNSLTTEDVHDHILPHINKPKSRILDVGCGSGRDAFYFANQGHQVVAIDPAEKLLAEAKRNHSHPNIIYFQDKLPELTNIKSKFDYILLSAVWMHIPENERAVAIKKLTSLLKPQGKMFLSLRFGDFNDQREALPVSEEEVHNYISDIKGFSAENINGQSSNKDMLNRPDVFWETLVITNNKPKPSKKNKP